MPVAQTVRRIQSSTALLEIWQPDDDGSALALTSQLRRHEHGWQVVASTARLKSGDGPAGIAWKQHKPVILQETPCELLRQLSQRHGMSLSAIIAWPIMRGSDVRAVCVLGLSRGPGAIELWSRDDRDELSIAASHYSGLKSFEAISRYVRFPKGAGVPGTVWKTGMPRLIAELSRNDRFMRTIAATEAQLDHGIGIPIGSSAGHCDSVLLMLSSATEPNFRDASIWTATSEASERLPVRRTSSLSWSRFDGLEVRRAVGVPSVSQPSNDAERVQLTLASSIQPVSSEVQSLISDERWSSGRATLTVTADSEAAILVFPVFKSVDQAALIAMEF